MNKTFRQRLDYIGPFDWAIMGILIGLFVGAVFGSRASHAASSGVDWFAWLDSFLQNSGTEMLGAFLTFVLLILVRGSWEKQEQEAAEEWRTEELKKLQQTVADELQNQIRGFTQAQELARLRATQTPEERQPILDSMDATGLLKGANLVGINLEGAQLWGANFEGANLAQAKLKGVVLQGANLEGVILIEANFEGANLAQAKLKGVVLQGANLEGADLRYTNLEGSDMVGANLEGANLRYAKFRGVDLRYANLEEADFEGAILPDGTKLLGRTSIEQAEGIPEPDWRTPFEAWDKAGRPRIEPADDEPEDGDQP